MMPPAIDAMTTATLRTAILLPLVGCLLCLPVLAQQTPCSQATTTQTVDETNITGNVTWSNTTAFILQDIVEVKDGGVLTIQEGTCIFGDADQEPSALVVRRGGQIIADATPDQPIIFSSANNTEFFDVGSQFQDTPGLPAAGDWGGVVIIGNAQCNGANDNTPGPTDDGITGDCEVEGLNSTLTGIEDFDATDSDGNGRLTFGGNSGIPGAQGLNNAENSGILRNVRIEYAGFDLGGSPGNPQGSGNELNILTLYGVGSGTTIENVHVKGGQDDGFEFFGGTVNVKRVVATEIQDDSFDYSYGWSGNAQFVLIQQTADASDKGFEADNNEAENGDEAQDYALDPLTNPNIYNITLIGDGGGQTFRLRRGVGGTIQNGLIAAFGEGIDTDDMESFNNCASGDLFVDNITFNDGTLVGTVGSIFAADTDPNGTTSQEQECAGSGVVQSPTLLVSEAELRSNANANFQPLANPPTATTDDPTSIDPGFFEAAPYRGAIAPSGLPFYLNGSWVRFQNTATP